MRMIVGVCFGALLSLLLLLGERTTAIEPQKNQMVKGTIKLVDVSKDLLVVNQKVKNEFVDRELSILDTTEFVIKTGKNTKTVIGKAGLQLLEGKEKSSVNIKCDKDVNVLRVTVMIKK